MDDLKDIWEKTKKRLTDLLPVTKRCHLSRVVLSSIKEENALFSCPSTFVFDNIKGYAILFSNVLSDILEKEIKVSFTIDPTLSKTTVESPKTNETPVVKEDKIKQKKKNPTLKSEYTLKNFIPGNNCNLAYKACEIIASNPGNTPYNPCLIYGGVGLGKTHLLQGIGNEICEKFPTMNVIYVTAEAFTNEFITSIGLKDENNKFKKKYRNADVLLMDDIHFFQKKEGVQEELFHTFVELYQKDKQIVFTCDRPINELTNITDRLKTRFSSGLNVDLLPPEYEVRVAIAKQKNKEAKLNLPENVIEYICQSINTNVRDLIGSLVTVSGVAKITGNSATIAMAKEQLKNLIVESQPITVDYTIQDVFFSVANYFNISLIDIIGTSRSKAIKEPRQIGIYIAYKYGNFTQSDIGKFLNKDHTSIGYTIQQIEALIENNEQTRHTIENIVKKLNKN